MKTALHSFTRFALAGALLAGFSMGGASGAPEPPSEFTVAKDGNNLTVGFGTLVGQTYTVEKSTTLAQGSWTDILSNVAGTGAVQTTTDADAGSLPKCFYRIRYSGAPMALIPAGSFEMGNALSASGDGYSSELPIHTAYVSAFYMEKNLVTKEKWDEVRAWGLNNGYTDLDVGNVGYASKGANHPVHSITWYAMVKWCNARSRKEGLTECYTVGGAVYKTGQSTPVLNMSASGYRLPTEAEWEKAARGGLSGKRFPWGDTINHSYANYYVYSSNGTTNYYSYDQGTPVGYDPAWATGNYPYTSPVGNYAANGYGLYDMSGNLWQWCWDWYGSYGSGTVSDPTGPASGSFRVLRGGGWGSRANYCRAAYRYNNAPTDSYYSFGFRCARSSVP